MGYRVLIADDSEMTRHIIKRNLGLSGLELSIVCEAENGEQAWEILCAQQFDLALVDISMPLLTGGELVARMNDKGMLALTRVLIVSSHRNDEVIEDLLSKGAHGFLSKPFTPEDFVAQVRQAMSIQDEGSV